MNDELIFYANETVKDYFEKAQRIYSGQSFSMPSVCFGVRGTTAGYANYNENRIRLNEKLFSENVEHFLRDTIPHELAHLLSFQLYGKEGMGHRTRWKSVMQDLGVQPKRCHCLATKPARIVRRQFAYRCGCGLPHNLTKIKHNRILRGTRYRCKRCLQILARI